jgi:hypothetical protein
MLARHPVAQSTAVHVLLEDTITTGLCEYAYAFLRSGDYRNLLASRKPERVNEALTNLPRWL